MPCFKWEILENQLVALQSYKWLTKICQILSQLWLRNCAYVKFLSPSSIDRRRKSPRKDSIPKCLGVFLVGIRTLGKLNRVSCVPHCSVVKWTLLAVTVTYEDAGHSKGRAGTDTLLLLPFRQRCPLGGRQFFAALNVNDQTLNCKPSLIHFGFFSFFFPFPLPSFLPKWHRKFR